MYLVSRQRPQSPDKAVINALFEGIRKVVEFPDDITLPQGSVIPRNYSPIWTRVVPRPSNAQCGMRPAIIHSKAFLTLIVRFCELKNRDFDIVCHAPVFLFDLAKPRRAQVRTCQRSSRGKGSATRLPTVDGASHKPLLRNHYILRGLP